jgi:hypothetical protein
MKRWMTRVTDETRDRPRGLQPDERQQREVKERDEGIERDEAGPGPPLPDVDPDLPSDPRTSGSVIVWPPYWTTTVSGMIVPRTGMLRLFVEPASGRGEVIERAEQTGCHAQPRVRGCGGSRPKIARNPDEAPGRPCSGPPPARCDGCAKTLMRAGNIPHRRPARGRARMSGPLNQKRQGKPTPPRADGSTR